MKHKILVTRATFDDVVGKLRERFEVEDNQKDDTPWTADELRGRLADKDGVLSTGSDRIDAALLDAAPRLKAVCNVAVGYNNVDLAACSERGIVATNTPGVLDDTTADTTWVLLMAAARRITEAERWLRAGNWKGWKNDTRSEADLPVLGVLKYDIGVIPCRRIDDDVRTKFSMHGVQHRNHPLNVIHGVVKVW